MSDPSDKDFASTPNPNRFDFSKGQSLNTLKAELSNIARSKQDSSLFPTQSASIIFKQVQQALKKNPSLMNVASGLDILHNLNSIHDSQNKDYSDYLEHALAILSILQNHLTTVFQKNSPELSDNLMEELTTLESDPNLIHIQSFASKTLNPFTIENKLYKIFRTIESIKNDYEKRQSHTRAESSQNDYAQLLNLMLQGNSPETVVPLLHESDSIVENKDEHLLPKTEYDPPSGEPDYPGRIGINRTMSFHNNEKLMSLLSAFSSHELKNDFLHSFSWAQDSKTISSSVKNVIEIQNDLLNLSPAISGKLQIGIIKYLLLSLDVLGKLCGNQGELALKNYHAIKEVTDKLKHVSSKIKNLKHSDHTSFEHEIRDMTRQLSSKNQVYFSVLDSFNPSILVKKNPELNGFCHLNERLSYALLGIEFKKSVLLPNEPNSGLKRKIDRLLGERAPSHKP